MANRSRLATHAFPQTLEKGTDITKLRIAENPQPSKT